MATSENWQLFIHKGRHNHKMNVYSHGHAQAARLTEEKLQKTEQFRKSHVPPRNILRFFREQNIDCAVRNGEDSNVLSDIVVAHPTSIAMLRTWPYVLIIDTTYKTNKDDSNRQELHSGNSFYVQRIGNDIQMGSSTNQALIFYICYVGW
ncbi:hypothetical protein M9H77_18214 [Catharanthus roseus]|uniref:Uncharacterized protein n=1 Tax=Catharanthus roseus TaxID=4058 RepID=A0ACC0B6U2_CATRO|nr:hypothetical protein M9H77_18214 [Catharanthus roseus]